MAPVTKSRTAPAHDATSIESKDLSAPAAISADELKEGAARPHAKADDADLGRDWRAVVFLKLRFLSATPGCHGVLLSTAINPCIDG
jgi:hypothetical protein